MFHPDAFYHACTYYERFLAVLHCVTTFTIFWYCSLLSKRIVVFRKMVYHRVRLMILLSTPEFNGDVVVIFLFLYSSSLLYLTRHPECFEVEQICFSCLTVYFHEIDVLAFFWLLFATFV